MSCNKLYLFFSHESKAIKLVDHRKKRREIGVNYLDRIYDTRKGFRSRETALHTRQSNIFRFLRSLLTIERRKETSPITNYSVRRTFTATYGTTLQIIDENNITTTVNPCSISRWMKLRVTFKGLVIIIKSREIKRSDAKAVARVAKRKLILRNISYNLTLRPATGT